MKFDILNIGDVCKGQDSKSFLVAMPALAFESEVHPPIEGELDAYEEAVLKFVSVGLSTGGISHVMNASENLIDEVMSHLECKRMVKKTVGNPWTLDDQGVEYLKGNACERPSDDSLYGFFFVNPIKRDVMPFFYHGDLSRAPLFDSYSQNDKKPIFVITCNEGEDSTFAGVQRPKTFDVQKAYEGYVKCDRILRRRANNEITVEEANSEIAALAAFETQFDDLDSLDEEKIEALPNVEAPQKKTATQLGKHQLVRLMHTKPGENPKKVYLTMRVVIDPSTAEGFRIVSPFNMRGVDEIYYIRQMMWLMDQSNVYISTAPGETRMRLKEFMEKEILKLCSSFSTDKKRFKVFAQMDIPHLVAYKKQYLWLYEILAGEYGVMQRIPNIREQKDIIREQKNIIRTLGSDVVEPLLNIFFKDKESKDLRNLSKRALDDLKQLGGELFLRQMLSKTFLSESDVAGWSVKNLDKPIRNMVSSHGNGAWEKLVNILVLNYYNPTDFTKRLLEADNISIMVRRIRTLNSVRNLVSHARNDANFEEQDYRDYKDNVFAFVEGVIEVLEKN